MFDRNMIEWIDMVLPLICKLVSSQQQYLMLLTSLQVQEEDTIPPGLMRPLLGCPKINQLPLFAADLTRILDNTEYELELFDDRVVGNYEGQLSYFCLDSEVSFTYNIQQKSIRFQNFENGASETFLTENQDIFLSMLSTLKPICAQSSFSQRFELIQEIGKGKKSQVFSALRKEDNQLYAIKIQTYSSYIWQQIAILRLLKHPNLIYFHEYFLEDNKVYIVMDYEDGGHLLDLIDTDNPFPNKEKIKIITDMLNALEFLRIKGIVHRDLKPENILYSKKDGNFKIADFGFAKKTGTKLDRIDGTPGFIAPEIFTKAKNKELEADVNSDIYSMGLIFYEMLTGKQYYEGESSDEILDKNIKGISLKNKSNKGFDINALEMNLLDKMIRSRPEKRKNSYEIIKSGTYNKLQKMYALEYSTTCSPSKNNKSSEQEDNDARFMNAVKRLLKMRSSSN